MWEYAEPTELHPNLTLRQKTTYKKVYKYLPTKYQLEVNCKFAFMQCTDLMHKML